MNNRNRLLATAAAVAIALGLGAFLVNSSDDDSSEVETVDSTTSTDAPLTAVPTTPIDPEVALLEVAEATMDALLSFDAAQIEALGLSDLETARMVYFQDFGAAADFEVVERIPCEAGTEIAARCDIVYRDDFERLLGPDTSTYRLTVIVDDDLQLDRIRAQFFNTMAFNDATNWATSERLDLVAVPCEGYTDQTGPTPEACAAALLAAFEQWPDRPRAGVVEIDGVGTHPVFEIRECIIDGDTVSLTAAGRTPDGRTMNIGLEGRPSVDDGGEPATTFILEHFGPEDDPLDRERSIYSVDDTPEPDAVESISLTVDGTRLTGDGFLRETDGDFLFRADGIPFTFDIECAGPTS